MRIRVATNGGVAVIHFSGKSISLDPKRESRSEFAFISHAHTDHLSRTKKKRHGFQKILASRATTVIANSRGHGLETPVETPEEFRLLDTGHILGSRGLLIPDELFYTGDVSTRDRAFLKSARIPKTKTLIVESTFARPEYIFPPLDRCIRQINELISEMYSKGVPLILMGYPLGKAQLLTEFFRDWDPMIVHESVYAMNSVYRDLGVRLRDCTPYLQAKEKGMFQPGAPWIMISPFMSGSSGFVRMMKSSYNAITVGFTGWAINRRFGQVMGLDYVIPISDHCDYGELLQIVESCNPEKVYTLHGFADYFALKLRTMGYDAEALFSGASGNQPHPASRRNNGERGGVERTKQKLIDSYFI